MYQCINLHIDVFGFHWNVFSIYIQNLKYIHSYKNSLQCIFDLYTKSKIWV
jgi:hypothetical protein